MKILAVVSAPSPRDIHEETIKSLMLQDMTPPIDIAIATNYFEVLPDRRNEPSCLNRITRPLLDVYDAFLVSQADFILPPDAIRLLSYHNADYVVPLIPARKLGYGLDYQNRAGSYPVLTTGEIGWNGLIRRRVLKEIPFMDGESYDLTWASNVRRQFRVEIAHDVRYRHIDTDGTIYG